MSRQFNEMYFAEIAEEQKTGEPSKWIEEQKETGDTGEYGDE